MEVKVGDTHCEATIKHFHYGDIIGGKQISPRSILKLVEFGNSCIHQICKTLPLNGDEAIRTLFLKWQQIQILPEFYKRKIDTSSPPSYIDLLNRQIKLRVCCSPIRNSSQIRELMAVDLENESPLFITTLLDVNVDPTTRRPKPFPQSHKDHFTAEKCQVKITIPQEMRRIGQSMFACEPSEDKMFVNECQINIRQLDTNNHTNQAAFADICYNCLGEAFANSAFGETSSILDHEISRMSILYLNEVAYRDKISTFVWQNHANPLIYKFNVKKGSDIVCQVEIELFPKSNSMKSYL